MTLLLFRSSYLSQCFRAACPNEDWELYRVLVVRIVISSAVEKSHLKRTASKALIPSPSVSLLCDLPDSCRDYSR